VLGWRLTGAESLDIIGSREFLGCRVGARVLVPCVNPEEKKTSARPPGSSATGGRAAGQQSYPTCPPAPVEPLPRQTASCFWLSGILFDRDRPLFAPTPPDIFPLAPWGSPPGGTRARLLSPLARDTQQRSRSSLPLLLGNHQPTTPHPHRMSWGAFLAAPVSARAQPPLPPLGAAIASWQTPPPIRTSHCATDLVLPRSASPRPAHDWRAAKVWRGFFEQPPPFDIFVPVESWSGTRRWTKRLDFAAEAPQKFAWNDGGSWVLPGYRKDWLPFFG